MGDDVTDQELDDLVRASDLVRSSAPYVLSSHSMDYALLLLTEKGEDMLPVLNDNEERRVVGVIHKTNVLMLYNHLLLEEKRHNQGD
jgi:CIC family chloride channel protein